MIWSLCATTVTFSFKKRCLRYVLSCYFIIILIPSYIEGGHSAAISNKLKNSRRSSGSIANNNKNLDLIVNRNYLKGLRSYPYSSMLHLPRSNYNKKALKSDKNYTANRRMISKDSQVNYDHLRRITTTMNDEDPYKAQLSILSHSTANLNSKDRTGLQAITVIQNLNGNDDFEDSSHAATATATDITSISTLKLNNPRNFKLKHSNPFQKFKSNTGMSWPTIYRNEWDNNLMLKPILSSVSTLSSNSNVHSNRNVSMPTNSPEKKNYKQKLLDTIVRRRTRNLATKNKTTDIKLGDNRSNSSYKPSVMEDVTENQWNTTTTIRSTTPCKDQWSPMFLLNGDLFEQGGSRIKSPFSNQTFMPQSSIEVKKGPLDKWPANETAIKGVSLTKHDESLDAIREAKETEKNEKETELMSEAFRTLAIKKANARNKEFNGDWSDLNSASVEKSANAEWQEHYMDTGSWIRDMKQNIHKLGNWKELKVDWDLTRNNHDLSEFRNSNAMDLSTVQKDLEDEMVDNQEKERKEELKEDQKEVEEPNDEMENEEEEQEDEENEDKANEDGQKIEELEWLQTNGRVLKKQLKDRDSIDSRHHKVTKSMEWLRPKGMEIIKGKGKHTPAQIENILHRNTSNNSDTIFQNIYINPIYNKTEIILKPALNPSGPSQYFPLRNDYKKHLKDVRHFEDNPWQPLLPQNLSETYSNEEILSSEEFHLGPITPQSVWKQRPSRLIASTTQKSYMTSNPYSDANVLTRGL